MLKLRIHDRQLRDAIEATVYQGNNLDLVIVEFKASIAEFFPRWTVHFEGDEDGGQIHSLDVQALGVGYADCDPHHLATIERESDE